MPTYDSGFVRGLRAAAREAARTDGGVWREYRKRRDVRREERFRRMLVGGVILGLMAVVVATVHWTTWGVGRSWPSPDQWHGLIILGVTVGSFVLCALLWRIPRGGGFDGHWFHDPAANGRVWDLISSLKLQAVGVTLASAWLGSIWIAGGPPDWMWRLPDGVAWALAAGSAQAATVWAGAQILARPAFDRIRRGLVVAVLVGGAAVAALTFSLPEGGREAERVLLVVPLSWPCQAFLAGITPDSLVVPLSLLAVSYLFGATGILAARRSRREFERIDLRAWVEAGASARTVPGDADAIAARIATGQFLRDEVCLGSVSPRLLDRITLGRLSRRERLVRWCVRGLDLRQSMAAAFTRYAGWTVVLLAVAFLPGWPRTVALLLVVVFGLSLVGFAFQGQTIPRAGPASGPGVPLFALYPIGTREVFLARWREMSAYRIIAILLGSLTLEIWWGLGRAWTGTPALLWLVPGVAWLVWLRFVGVGLLDLQRVRALTGISAALAIVSAILVIAGLQEMSILALIGIGLFALSLAFGSKQARDLQRKQYDWLHGPMPTNSGTSQFARES